MALHVDGDGSTSAQAHLDELTVRTTRVFVLVGLASLIWYRSVDAVLDIMMVRLSPCLDDCLNIYEPAQWSVVRWMTALLLGVLSCLPLALHQAFQFAKPGLMLSERQALRAWMVLTAIVVLAGSWLLVAVGVPKLYAHGYEHHRSIGLDAQYSALNLLTMAGYAVVVWLTMTSVWFSTVCLGWMGWITSATAPVWRWRLYGVATLVLVAATPPTARSAILPLLLTTVAFNEQLGRRWWTTLPLQHGRLVETFDDLGARRRRLYVDCSCAGANAHGGAMMEREEACLRVEALCLHRQEQERLIQYVVGANITDVVVTGCDGHPCPSRVKTNLANLKCTLSGLNLMSAASHRGDPAHVHPLDLEQAILRHRVPLGLMHGINASSSEHEGPRSTASTNGCGSMKWVPDGAPIGD